MDDWDDVDGTDVNDYLDRNLGEEMIIEPKVKSKSRFVNATKLKEILKEGDAITILSEGEKNPFDKVEFLIKLPDDTEVTYAFNDTSLQGFVSAWGNDSKEWTGNRAFYRGVQKMGKMAGVLFEAA